jgi:hypothetical protein
MYITWDFFVLPVQVHIVINNYLKKNLKNNHWMICNKLLNVPSWWWWVGGEFHLLNSHDLKDIGPVSPELVFLCLSGPVTT